MASLSACVRQSHQHQPVRESSTAEPALQEAQTWIEAVTGRCFADKDFRGGLENGILLCELLSSIKPSLVKKINRLPTPIAGLDNLSVFLRGCEELGLKGSQLFDPGDLQDTTTRPSTQGSDCSRRLKNVLITIYWLGRAANSCITYNGPTLNLKEFEGLLLQMRKEAEEAESPQRSIRDSGYIDCWDSERSDSLSPPRHGREDSLDSLDSFGSRSPHTPSPDVPVAPGNSDGNGSDSESDGPPNRKMPDVRKDDMLARRTSVTELKTAMPFNQYLPNKSNQSGYVPTPLRKKGDKEEGGRKSCSTATSPVGGDRPISAASRSCSEELFHPSATVTPVTNQEKTAVDNMLSCQTSPQHLTNSTPVGFLPPPVAAATASILTADVGQWKGRALSESNDASWLESNPTKSVSMIDMRGEEDPHSQVRHELMHNQYNRLKEEEDHWQDDLARWKNRRRSISQDLIKKEEERKMVEQLMTGDNRTSQRRRSVKTYREIVEDKERREEELRIEYRKARTPEEASAILQRYAHRFSISETVLERLQLPKLLDRSVSADPSLSTSPFPLSLSLSSSPTTPDPFDEDPDGPLRYLRQQSSPAPKFMSILEARIEEFPKDLTQRPQIRSRSSEPVSTRAHSPKAVPLLSPKPYFPSRTTAETWNSKVDGRLQVNGDSGKHNNLVPPWSRATESPPQFQASCSISTDNGVGAPCSDTSHPHQSVHTSARDASPTRTKETQSSSNRPVSLPVTLQKPEESFKIPEDSTAAASEEGKPNLENQQTKSTEAKHDQAKTELSLNFYNRVQCGVNSQQIPSVLSQLDPAACFQNTSQSTESVLSCPGPTSFEHRPSENTEKDYHGNEKYQREQEKLTEEWERAQREVAEEERRYHEEERRILEETTAPLTPPSRGEPSSNPGTQSSIIRSLADWERKQEAMERPSRGSTEGAECKFRENDRTSDISTADDSMKTVSLSPISSQADVLAHNVQNGQKVPTATPKASAPAKRNQEVAAENRQPGQPAGGRRSGFVDNHMSSSSSSSKSPPACPSPSDTLPPAPNRSVSGKKLCSSCAQPLGKGAAMIIETLSLYFHIHCFQCGLCKGQLGDTTTGTDVRIRNGLLNCHQCYIRSRSAGQPTTL
ncbi:LIM and calponin homology domains-containing protein 1-like isoform X3 [Gouania willdenowi]|uniref:LIM and calponin homology domains 1b n=1 Tax=Gouania willdenowi TaxID=441366 RepID=A0A8C5GF37_GOUWI|nr:LIM and calponin homology domains-containing protein 1 isoform X3 [Gouania willdenowi]